MESSKLLGYGFRYNLHNGEEQDMRICILILLAGVGVHAQWLNHRDPETPRTKDGKPNLSAPAPRASSGKPDLSGVWQAEGAPSVN